MAEHSPAPWAVHPITAQVDAFATGEPVPVCRLLWPTEARSEDETEANGHLIAAAPDLLAACKQAEFAFRAAAGTRVEDELMALELLRAAIAKAEAK